MSDLESMIDELARYGMPRITLFDRGWFCKVELNVKVDGGVFEIKSEFGHSNAKSAVFECLSRVRQCLADIHKLAPTIPHNPQLKALEAEQ